jgi:putative tryptophan/tyrosine transport system ATP-binding protein
MNNTKPFLRIEDIRKTYNQGTPQEIIALDNMSLEIPEGEFVSIIGSNGSGKTSFLNAIAGAIKITSGRIILNNFDITDKPLHTRAGQISRVYQDPAGGTSSTMTVEQNLVLATLRGRKAGFRFGVNSKRREFISNSLKELGIGLETRLNEKVSNLSGGQRQALAMIMATIVKPKILLLDEHVAALDPRMSRVIMEMTEKLVQTHGLTTLMVSHDMELAIKHGHRLIMLHQGKIVKDLCKDDKAKVTEQELIEEFRKLRQIEEEMNTH